MSDVPIQVLQKRVESPKGAELVDDLLYHFPEARGDDRRLYWRYVTQVLGVRLSFSEASKLFKGFSSDTLGRRRRELIVKARQEGDDVKLAYLLPREGTQRKRMKRCKVYAEFYGGKLQRQIWDFEVLG
jgi:hypothetical protein